MRKSPRFSPEVVERAVRMVFDAKDQYPSQWTAIESIAGKIGCTAETLRRRIPLISVQKVTARIASSGAGVDR